LFIELLPWFSRGTGRRYSSEETQLRHAKVLRLVGRCELADLLVVTDWKLRGKVTRTAALIQAKMAARVMTIKFAGSSSTRQLALYQRWPLFTFVDAGTYGTKSFDLTPIRGRDAGTFGIIDRHCKNSTARPPAWTQHSARPTPSTVTREPTLGGFLAGMAGGLGPPFGRPVQTNPRDDWTEVVELLLRVTYKKLFRHRATLGRVFAPRGVSAAAFLAPATQGLKGGSAGGARRPPFDAPAVIDETPGGPSLFHMVIET
jgi:hypothetical protein